MSQIKAGIRIEGDAKGATDAAREAEGALRDVGTEGATAGRRTRDGAREAQSGLELLREKARGVFEDIKQRAAGAIAGVIGIGAAGAALRSSVVDATQFGTAMAEVSTLLKDTSGMDQLSESVRSMTREFGGTAPAQAKGLYEVISAGASDAASAVETLTVANKLAVGGVTEVAVAADGLTTILNAYGTSAGTATDVADRLFTAALAGKTTIGELASSIGSVAPLAAQTGVSLDEVLAATAALTLGGVSTSESMNGLRAVIATIIGPTKEASDLAEQLGLKFDAQGLKAKGLAGFLEEVRAKTGGSAEQMKVLFSGVEALVPVLSLTGSQAENVSRILGEMGTSAGATETAFGKMSETAGRSFGRLQSEIKDRLLLIGTEIIDVLAPVALSIANNFDKIDAAVSGVVDIIQIAGPPTLLYFGLFKGMPALMAATAAAKLQVAAAIASIGTASAVSVASVGALKLAGMSLVAAFAGWQIGTYLREQFVEARLAGIAFVEGTLVAYQRLREGVLVVWEGIKAAGTGALNTIREGLSSLLSGLASAADVEVFGTKLLGNASAEIADLAAALRPATSAADGLAAAVLRINDEAERNIRQIRQTTGEMADFETAQDAATRATAAGTEAKAASSTAAADLAVAQAAAAGATDARAAATGGAAAADRVAAGAVDLHAQALDRLTRMGDQLAAELGGPVVRAAQTLRDRLVDVDAAERQLIATGMDAAQAAVVAGQVRTQAMESYAAAVQSATDATVASGQQIVDSAATQAEQWGEAWDSGAGQAMRAIEDWGRNGFRGLGDDLSQMMGDIRGQLVAMFARPLVIPILAQLGLGGGAGGIGGQGGLLQSLMGQGGLFGGGTPLSGGIGNFFSQLSGSISTGVGSALSGIGGFFSQGAAFQGAGVLGSVGNFGSGLATAGSNIAGAGFFGSMGANLSGGFAALGSGSIAAGLGQLIPVIGQIAAIASVINSLAGGRLFGTSFRPEGQTTSLNLGADGGDASASVREVRQRSLFRGRTWRDRSVEAGDEAEQAAQGLFDAVREVMVQAARSMQADAPEMIGAALRTVQEFDKLGKVTATKYFVDVLGRTWEEATAEAATMRISAEALISTIDAALGTTVSAAAAAVADAGTEVVGSFGDAFVGAAGELRDDIGTGIQTVLKSASEAVQGEASAIAERWRGDAETLMDGATMLLAAATDIRRGAGLLGDGSLTAVADLIEDMAVEGESLAATYARVSASTQLLEQALDLSGLSLDRTREEFVRFATDITTAAGGLDRAQQLWNAFYQGFFTAQERALLAQQRALAAAVSEFEDIGQNVGDFQGEGGLQAFRAAFDQVLQTGSAEAIVQWLEAAEALGILTQATAQLGTGAALVADSLAEFMASIDGGLAQLTPEAGLAEQLAAQRTANAELLARAQELGASEAELARVRQLGDARIREIISSVASQTATLTSALQRLGIAVTGSQEDLALMAAQVSGEFEQLFASALESLYTPAERAAMQLSVAQQGLAQALTAAGLASDQAVTRAQLRAQIEQALASGNARLAESLLRVVAALNAVESAAGSATAAVGGLVDEFGRPVGGPPIGGTGGGGAVFAGNGGGGVFDSGAGLGAGVGGAGQALVNTIDDLRAGLRDWLTSLTTGELSPLRPREQLAQSRAELARLVAAAQGGDIEAMRQLSGAGDAVLRLGQQVFRGADYRALFDEVRRMIGGVAGVGVTPISGGSGGSGGVGTRPGDDLGDLGRSALGAAAALDMLAARAGMPPGSLTVPPPRPLPQFGAASDQAFSEASARPVVQELQRGRAESAQENARLQARLAELSARMDRMSAAAERSAEELARANDYRRVV